MTSIALLLIAASFAVVVWQITYFSQQRNECQKYPFYKLRDDIVWHLATSSHDNNNLETYDRVNRVISRLKYFNFAFHTELITRIAHDVLEDGYKCDFDPSRMGRKDNARAPTPFEARFMRLVVRTGRMNSVLIRLSTTRFGYVLLITGSLPRALIRFHRNHPEVMSRCFNRVRTLRRYSMVNQLVTQSA